MSEVTFGLATITSSKKVIDCDAPPFIPNGWSIDKHQKGGQMEWDASKVSTYFDDAQKTGGIEGHKLRRKLANQKVLNANVLDFLLENQHLIPEEWKSKAVFFWGTIYRLCDVYLCVRYLYWDGGKWRWLVRWLGKDWNAVTTAVVSTS
jgi:hypothetical protein